MLLLLLLVLLVLGVNQALLMKLKSAFDAARSGLRLGGESLQELPESGNALQEVCVCERERVCGGSIFP